MDNILLILDVLKYGIIIVFTLGLAASILSPFVVLNEQSLIADGLSHVSFTALAVGLFFFDEPFYVAIPIVVLSSVLVKWISQYAKIHGDAALGMVSSVGFAIGLIVIKFSNNFIDLESLISGNLWLRKVSDVWLSLGVLLIAGTFVLLNYRKLISLTFDFEYAKFSGIKADLLSYLFAAITGIFVVVGVRSIGVLLISSLLIFPVVTANLLSKSFKELFIYGAAITFLATLVGVILAHVLNIPAGSTIVIVYAILFVTLTVTKKIARGHVYE